MGQTGKFFVVLRGVLDKANSNLRPKVVTRHAESTTLTNGLLLLASEIWASGGIRSLPN